MRPKRTNNKYWQGTRNFDHIAYESDLEDYIIHLENEIQQLRKHNVVGRYVSELEIEYKHPSGKHKGRLMYEDDDSDYLILKCNGAFISLPELNKCKVINALNEKLK